MRFSAVCFALGALLLPACLLERDDLPGHEHPGHQHVNVAPELPRLRSTALSRLETATLSRKTAMTSDLGPDISARVSGNRRITQKILLLGATGSEPSYQSAKTALDRLGVPYQAVLVNTETVTDALLSDGISKCHFSGVIVATGGLGLDNNGVWESGMTPAEWQSLADFEGACSAREVVWYGWPGAEFGLSVTGSFDSNAAVTGQLTAAGKTMFNRVRDDAQIPYRHAYGYRASVIDATTTPLVQAADGGVLVATHVGPDGRESMISTVDQSPYLTHSVALEYELVRWVSRNMFVGKKRAYLTAQVDDIFLANDMWSLATHHNDPSIQFRITGSDLTSFAAWQATRQQTLPAGSTFITEMAFNGLGTQAGEYADTSLVAAARQVGNSFRWLNHTWDHDNMDAMTRADARNEVARNCNLARSSLRLNGLSCTDLVTPDMSGLLNLNAVRGMLDAGVRYVVSDTSITEALRPANPGSNPSFNVGRANPLDSALYQIPRHPTSIFYDVSTPQTETDEYNTIYRAYYGRDLSYEEVLDKDSEFGLYYLLQGDIDPLMFHQANLKKYGPTNRTLYGDWVDAVVTKYLRLFDAPILSPSQGAIGAEMIARGKLNGCGVTATVVEFAGSRSLELRSTGSCVVPVTGISAAAAGTVEVYAGEPTTYVALSPGVVRTLSPGVVVGR
jgi:hypothetical protein